MYDQILVPTDGSDGTSRAVDQAVDLAATFDATLHTIYVVDNASLPPDVSAGSILEALERTGEEATDSVVTMAESAGVDVKSEVLHGTPYRTIVEYAEEADIDLIVMGTHGRSGLGRYLLGSVTEKVVRIAEVPVLTVRMTDDDAPEPEELV
ncbi:MAG: universal stress protein [Halobacteriales archaeon]|nr:universal stress protein [Halobacteriales archaeon]